MNHFKVSFIILIALFFSSQTSAQFGLRVKSNINNFPTWNRMIQESLTQENDVLTSNFELGLDYRFKMKNIRIDILNEITYGFRSESILTNFSGMQFSYFAFNINTQIYAFNLHRENGIDKTLHPRHLLDNLFFTLSPGIVFHRTVVSHGLILLPTLPSDQISLKLGTGVGFDFKIGDSFIISPCITYNYIHNIELLLSPVSIPPSETGKTNLHQFQFHLRFGF
ncbi:MAG: hypothetical protein AAGA77_09150 [Bacteroidota bacterium]